MSVDRKFLSRLFILIFIFVVLDYIMSYIFYYLSVYFHTTYYEFLSGFVSIIIFAFFLSLMINIYLLYYHRRFLSGSWTKFTVITMFFPTTCLILVLIWYHYILVEVLTYYKPYTIVRNASMYLGLLSLFIALIYHAALPISLVLWERKSFQLRSVFGKILLVLKFTWAVKGGFLIYVFFGFLVINLIGFLIDVLIGISSIFLPIHIILIFIIKPFTYTLTFNIYFKYFIEKYMLDIIMYIRSHELV